MSINNSSYLLCLQFNAYGVEGREDQLPHLQYNENLTQFDLNLDHLATNFSDSRWAVEIISVGSNSEDMFLDESRSIDDEYAPGVFQVWGWLL